MATLRPAGSLLLLLVAILTFDQGVHAHFKPFKAHFDNPEECIPTVRELQHCIFAKV